MIVAIANQKGGVGNHDGGKLAAALLWEVRRSIDLDPQANSSISFLDHGTIDKAYDDRGSAVELAHIIQRRRRSEPVHRAANRAREARVTTGGELDFPAEGQIDKLAGEYAHVVDCPPALGP
jgi:cellulose biosynthesis protein BcsQ